MSLCSVVEINNFNNVKTGCHVLWEFYLFSFQYPKGWRYFFFTILNNPQRCSQIKNLGKCQKYDKYIYHIIYIKLYIRFEPGQE